MDDLIASLHVYAAGFSPLTLAEITFFSELATVKRLQKKEILIGEGKVANTLLFFTKGYFRFFHVKPDGTEVTRDFIFPPGFITSYTSFITRHASTVSVQAMEETEGLEISFKDLQELYTRYHSFERLGRMLAESAFIQSEKHLLSFLNDQPSDRYLWLLREYPGFIQQIPLHYLASYLGVTPETLSRIRRRIS